MDTSDPIDFPRPAAWSGTGRAAATAIVAFDRRELSHILNVYGRMVAAGLWKDYAINHTRDRATFSIYRRTTEMPLFRVVKTPKLARKQGAYAVLGPGGQILKRGHTLPQVLRFFEKRRLEVVE